MDNPASSFEPLRPMAAALKRRWHLLAVAALIGLQTLLMARFMMAASPVYDEPALLCASLNFAKNKDFSISPELGPFSLGWLALPNLHLQFPAPGEVSANVPNFYQTKVQPLLERQGQLKAAYFRSRCMTALLSIGCGLLIFYAALRSAGRLPAVLALAVYCFLPLFLSNGALATSDMSMTFASALCCLALAHFFHRLDARSLLFTAFAASLLAMSKQSALLMAPAALLALGVKCALDSPLRMKLPFLEQRVLLSSWRKLAALLCALALIAVLAYAALWAGYGFRYSMHPPGVSPSLPSPERMDNGGVLARALLFAMEKHLLPAAYAYGILGVNSMTQERFSFLNGEVSMHGFRGFFPLAFLMKTPPPALLAFAIGAGAFLWGMFKLQGRRRMMCIAPFLVFAGVYLAAALSTNLNIGIRHLMPLFPALLLLAALGFRELLRVKGGRPLPYIIAAACAVAAFAASPFQLAYFSPFFGGAANASKHLVDSSLDWGQDLWNLKGSLNKLGVKADGSEKIYLAYFGGMPAASCGFPATILPFPLNDQFDSRRVELEPGVYCVSATLLRGANLPFTDTALLDSPEALKRLALAFNAFKYYQGKDDAQGLKKFLDSYRGNFVGDCMQYELLRFELLRRVMAEMEPIGNAGHSIFVYALTPEDLRKALEPAFNFKMRGMLRQEP